MHFLFDICINQSLPIYMGQEGNMYGEYNSDGDLNQIFYDLDGSATGYSDSYAVRPDNWLVRTEDCIDVPEFNAAICTEEAYGVVSILEVFKTLETNNLQRNYALVKMSSVYNEHYRVLTPNYKTFAWQPQK